MLDSILNNQGEPYVQFHINNTSSERLNYQQQLKKVSPRIRKGMVYAKLTPELLRLKKKPKSKNTTTTPTSTTTTATFTITNINNGDSNHNDNSNNSKWQLKQRALFQHAE